MDPKEPKLPDESKPAECMYYAFQVFLQKINRGSGNVAYDPDIINFIRSSDFNVNYIDNILTRFNKINRFYKKRDSIIQDLLNPDSDQRIEKTILTWILELYKPQSNLTKGVNPVRVPMKAKAKAKAKANTKTKGGTRKRNHTSQRNQTRRYVQYRMLNSTN